jgi:hypothetical protein
MKTTCLLAIVLAAVAIGKSNASVLPPVYTAYQVPAGTVGNQQLPSSQSQTLGNDFNVNSPIQVFSLGVFDSGGDGLLGTLVARIYDRDTQASLASITFTGNDGVLIGGSRFLDLPTPLTLNAGFHGIISVAYLGSELEPDGNLRMGPGNWTTDDGGGLIGFVGDGRHSWMGTGDAFPDYVDPAPAPNNFAAGTFTYAAVPEPTVLSLFALGVLGSVWRSQQQRTR